MKEWKLAPIGAELPGGFLTRLNFLLLLLKLFPLLGHSGRVFTREEKERGGGRRRRQGEGKMRGEGEGRREICCPGSLTLSLTLSKGFSQSLAAPSDPSHLEGPWKSDNDFLIHQKIILAKQVGPNIDKLVSLHIFDIFHHLVEITFFTLVEITFHVQEDMLSYDGGVSKWLKATWRSRRQRVRGFSPRPAHPHPSRNPPCSVWW